MNNVCMQNSDLNLNLPIQYHVGNKCVPLRITDKSVTVTITGTKQNMQ